ncbi:IclR family transcriptional regulator [Phenylobacterium sp. LjRoot219]|uniref:IclR family transcriptional regulator n=1 Tax=Phenylobacterium sp. LjRoot219 TaxID=3342283 RepID=UPI003F5017D1
MARPALSASRTTEVLDLLTAFPGRAFTMAEIVRATKINVASCHAVLAALTSRGYLTRLPQQKTYVLGPALIAVGPASRLSQPLIARAQDAARELFNETGVPVLLSTIVGEDILALTSLVDRAGRSAGMRLGQRMPLEPPLGAHFVAWASEPAIEAWLARGGEQDPELVQAWRDALALVRKRGFQVTLGSSMETEFATLMAEMASGRQPIEYRDQATSLVGAHPWRLSQPDTIEPAELYDVVLIAAPIFDQSGEARLSLCLGGFGEKLTGAQITAYADQLLRVCLQVMREDRGG